MKRLLLLWILLVTISGCKYRGGFVINGVIKGEKEKYVRISRIDVNIPVLIDSSIINNKGEFKFKIKSSEPDFYQLSLSSANFMSLLAKPGEKIKLVFETPDLFEKYSVTGSEGSDQVRVLDMNLIETKRRIDSLTSIYNKASMKPGFDTTGPSIEGAISEVIKAQRKKNIEFIITNPSSLASIKAVYQRINPQTYVLYDPRDLQYLKIAKDSLTAHFPGSKHVKALVQDFEREMSQNYFKRIQEISKSIPESKLDPDLKNAEGKRIALSSLKGKYVLLSFWSYESRASIQENFQLKELYKIYKKKGFEIYQINLDESEADWKSAVKFDELPWISTREDDPLNPKNARLFNVSDLPANYLFDREGQIVAVNLHGKSLNLKLEQIFK